MVLTFTPKPIIGQSLPAFSLPGTDGQTYTPDSFSESKILMIIFTCNHCPYAILAKPKLEKLHADYHNRGVQLIAINPNDADNYPEDSFDNMKLPVNKLPFPYLRDESQAIAKAFGAVCTPDIFVYNRDRKLVYRGQMDSERPSQSPAWKPDNPAFNLDIKQALDALLSGQAPDSNQKPSSGCSIKWRE